MTEVEILVSIIESILEKCPHRAVVIRGFPELKAEAEDDDGQIE